MPHKPGWILVIRDAISLTASLKVRDGESWESWESVDGQRQTPTVAVPGQAAGLSGSGCVRFPAIECDPISCRSRGRCDRQQLLSQRLFQGVTPQFINSLPYRGNPATPPRQQPQSQQEQLRCHSPTATTTIIILPNPEIPPSMSTETKDRITCHILDTTLGQPARGVRVKLELISTTTNPTSSTATANKVFESQTDDDGRIKAWLPYSSATSSGEVPVYTLEDVLGGIGGDSRWTLRFDSAGYFGGADKTFYPEVDVTFTVREGERYHVPLLLAPYGYSTYRGS
ncbi:hypothetical protein VTI74DRAFT_6778 [Chaetomium olivicolor]